MAYPCKPRAAAFTMPVSIDRVIMAFLRQGTYCNAAMFMDGVPGPVYTAAAGQAVAPIHVVSTLLVADERYLVALYMPGWHANRSEFAVAEYYAGQLIELWSANDSNVVFVPSNSEYAQRVVKIGAGPAKRGALIECDWLTLSPESATKSYKVAAQR